ncbi:MAG: cyclic nucleotide-binding domain-containing protein [Chlorobi bacterium]|nr:cyclic nucleotide-binding domain-containing protein [Chlorobiota bacterium]MCI0716503.1 cyclic nucleotide-binding domain-containing protein [Chlorobiota bacterium]
MFGKRKSDTDILVSTIKNCELFSGLSVSEIKSLISVSHIRDYSEGEKIFFNGTIGLCMYLIVKGSVQIFTEDGGKVSVLKEFTEGAFFSEVHLFSQTDHSVSCMAKEVTRLLAFAKPDIDDLVKIKPRLGNKVLLRFLDFFGKKLDELYKENSELKNKLHSKTQ